MHMCTGDGGGCVLVCVQVMVGGACLCVYR